MAVAASRGRSELQRKWKERENTISPERTRVWSEPSNKLKTNDNVEPQPNQSSLAPVVYYLSRNGQLEHPHFMEVPLSSPDGLFLRDVINRLNLLRGKGMASQYSWSSKRSYKNGYVWHDLEENDFIHPVHGGEYVLKGSEILETVSSPVSKSPETSSSSNGKTTAGDSPAVRDRRRDQSWGAVDLQEYKVVYKAESTRELKAAADASTQTEDKRRRKAESEETHRREKVEKEEEEQQRTELSKDEISPPPSDSSPETLESLMKADGRILLSSSQAPINQSAQSESVNRTVGSCPSGRMKASSVLMSLISCGSISFRECGATTVKEHGMSLVDQYRNRVTCGGDGDQTARRKDDDQEDDVMAEIESHASSSFAKMALEDKGYFSGSLIQTNKDEFPALKRSSSYNADRNWHLKVGVKEEEGVVTAKCIPRRAKTTDTTKQ